MGKYPIYTRVKRGKTVYVLDYGKIYDPTVGRSRRKQKQFSKRKLAEDERKTLIEKQDTSGPSSAILTFDERSDARRAIEILAGQASLVDAATAYIRSSRSAIVKISINSAVDDWVQSKVDSNRRHKTVKDASYRGDVLKNHFHNRDVGSITNEELFQWFDTKCPSGSRKNYRTLFHGFWQHAVKKGWARTNIVKQIPIPAVDQSDPHIFDLKSSIRLLRATESYCPELIPYFSIGLFAGLRPDNELRNLDWSNINLSKKTIRVTAATAKRRRKRIVAISDNLKHWLEGCNCCTGKIFYSRQIIRRIRALAGIEWHQDIMRHSFGSYHLAKHNDVAYTAMQMGHSSADMILNHYYALVEDHHSRMFWDIVPKTVKQSRIQERINGSVEITRAAS